MVKVDEYEVPEGLYYTKEFGWVKVEGDKARVGITDYAQKQLREIVYAELPSPGTSTKQNDPYGTVESVKAVAELYMPVGGEILAVNTVLEDSPELMNRNPYGDGWLIEIKPDDLGELESLMDNDAYKEMLEGLEEE